MQQRFKLSVVETVDQSQMVKIVSVLDELGLNADIQLFGKVAEAVPNIEELKPVSEKLLQGFEELLSQMKPGQCYATSWISTTFAPNFLAYAPSSHTWLCSEAVKYGYLEKPKQGVFKMTSKGEELIA